IASQDPEMVRNIREGLAAITEVSLRDGREAWSSMTARLNRRRARGVEIAAHRDAVLARSRSQRARGR
ncbi:MAG: hypothetical protein V3V35_04115, partial [Dehalococcoidia bacterium]